MVSVKPRVLVSVYQSLLSKELSKTNEVFYRMFGVLSPKLTRVCIFVILKRLLLGGSVFGAIVVSNVANRYS